MSPLENQCQPRLRLCRHWFSWGDNFPCTLLSSQNLIYISLLFTWLSIKPMHTGESIAYFLIASKYNQTRKTIENTKNWFEIVLLCFVGILVVFIKCFLIRTDRHLPLLSRIGPTCSSYERTLRSHIAWPFICGLFYSIWLWNVCHSDGGTFM